jgi:hypothetical protein
MLAATPANALAPIHSAAVRATRAAAGLKVEPVHPWTPHVTVAYSITEQPSQPIINALGLRLPERHIQLCSLDLVIQEGPERGWDWTIRESIEFDTSAAD